MSGNFHQWLSKCKSYRSTVLLQPGPSLLSSIALSDEGTCAISCKLWSGGVCFQQLSRSSNSACELTCCRTPCTVHQQCSAAAGLDYCNSLCTLTSAQRNGPHPVIDIRPTTVKYSGIVPQCNHYYYYEYDNRFTALWTLSGVTRVSRCQKGKTNLFYWSKRQWMTVASAICKSAPCPRQITTPAPNSVTRKICSCINMQTNASQPWILTYAIANNNIEGQYIFSYFALDIPVTLFFSFLIPGANACLGLILTISLATLLLMA